MSGRTLLRLGLPETHPIIKDLALGRFLQPHQVRNSVLLPHPLPPMMMKISPRLTVKGEIPLNHKTAVSHREVPDLDVPFHSHYLLLITIT